MYSEEHRTTWLERESKKHVEMIDWLLDKLNQQGLKRELETIKNNPKISSESQNSDTNENKKIIINKKIISILNNISNEDFKKMKSKWSSRVNRKSHINISCSIDPSIYKKLIKIKGKHQLKDTLETMISLTYQRQTTENLLDMKKPKTTPLLENYPTIESTEIKITSENSDTFTSLHSTMNSMQETISRNTTFISGLLKRVDALEKKA